MVIWKRYTRWILVIFTLTMLMGGIFLIRGGVFLHGEKSLSDPFARFARCNNISPHLRFSCYRSVLEWRYPDPLQLLADIQRVQTQGSERAFQGDDQISYAIFGTNCHTFYHAVGDFLAMHIDSPDIPRLFNWCPNTCTSGCYMGLMKRIAFQSGFRKEVLAAFYPSCDEKSKHQCAHEIGHLLHDKYIYPVLKVLDELTRKHYGFTSPSPEDALHARRNDLDAPFEECKELLPQNEWPYCFTGIGHNLFLFSEFAPDGYKTLLAECDNKTVRHRDDCYAFLIYRIGINMAAPKFLSHNPEEGNTICRDVIALAGREDLAYHCWTGIGGGIGLYVDSEYSLENFTTTNMGVVKRNVLDFAKLCEFSEHAFVERCFIGLMGTPFKRFYQALDLYHETIEKLKPMLDDDFQVVG